MGVRKMTTPFPSDIIKLRGLNNRPFLVRRMKMINKFLCWLLEHTWEESNYRGLYEICSRCRATRKV